MNNTKKIWLTNALGENYDLTDINHFAYTLSGVDLTTDNEYKRFHDQYLTVNDILEQQKLTMDIFFKNGYDTYLTFIKFIRKSPLKFHYQPLQDEFIINCRLSGAEKSIKGPYDVCCKASFDALGLFYKEVVIESTNATEGEGKKYDYTYDYVYSNYSFNALDLDVDGTEKSPCIIEINGPCTNPTWRQYVDGILVTTGKYNGVLTNNEKLVIDTVNATWRMVINDKADNYLRDAYQYSDFSTERFIYLAPGHNHITFGADTADELQTRLKGLISYATV